MGVPTYKIGDTVTVQDKSYQPVHEVGKKEPVSYVRHYKWQGIITGIGYDIKGFYGAWHRRLVPCSYPMLIQDYPIYY